MTRTFSLVFAALGLAASPLAFAHATLLASTPAADAAVASPAEMHLTFSEHVEPRGSSVKLTSADGKHFDADRPHVDKADPKSLVASVPVLRPGVYKASWTAAGGDGHKTHGTFSFTVK